jgi:hypothetical protein
VSLNDGGRHLERPLNLIEIHQCGRCGWISSSRGGYIVHPCRYGRDWKAPTVYDRVPPATLGFGVFYRRVRRPPLPRQPFHLPPKESDR